MYVVYRGNVDQFWRGNHITLGPGTVVGLSDALNSEYDSTYTALDEVTVFPCYYSKMDDLNKVFMDEPVYIFGFAKGSFRQCRDVFAIYDAKRKKVDDFYDFCNGIYREYKKQCKALGAPVKSVPLFEDMTPIELEGEIKKWEHNYIASLNSVDNKEIENIYGKSVDIVNGVIGISCGYMKRAIDCTEIMGFYLEEFSPILLSEDGEDIFNLFYELRVFAAERRLNPDEITKDLDMLYKFISESGQYEAGLIKSRWSEYKNHNFHEDTQAFEQAQEEEQAQYDDCFAHICEFAGYTPEETEKQRVFLTEFMALADKEGKEDLERRTRKKAVDMFYQVYEKAFFASLKTYELDPIITMFLNFGFMDLDALGADLAEELAELTEKLFICQSENVFTIYTWLKAVYNGEREPSKNELDLDYRGFIIEERKSGNIPEDKVQAYMADQDEKVKFEINNFFKSANRTTSGKMTAFCPILKAEDFSIEPNRMLLTVSKLKEAMAKIEEVDFSIFLREGFFTDMEANIKSESYLKRVQPDIILLPNVGMRAMMWQECGGIKVDSPGRFVFPLFTLDDLDKLMIYCCGAYRWEICRKEQGARWNDISSECLTSDFYDYFTFYRKNKDLSAENKEKVKTLLKSSRNNMREAFTKQYTIYINFEAQGSIRLNKSERNILAKYCPFSKPYRSKVSSHPMYEQSVSRYEIKTSQALHHMHAVFDKYEKNGGVVPEEVKQGMQYLQM